MKIDWTFFSMFCMTRHVQKDSIAILLPQAMDCNDAIFNFSTGRYQSGYR